MGCDLEPLSIAGRPLWRVGHAPDPWQFPDWAYADQAGRFDYECTDDLSRPQFDGIHYLSRLGDDLENYALFELPQAHDRMQDIRLTPVDPDDEELQRALEHLGLRWFDDAKGAAHQ